MSVDAVLTDLYVYYQVEACHAPALAARVRAMQAALACGTLKRRPGEADGRQTWMEIYAGCTPEQRAAIETAVAAAGLDELTTGARHTEVFIDLDQTIVSEAAGPCA
jgi:hypothetical protein